MLAGNVVARLLQELQDRLDRRIALSPRAIRPVILLAILEMRDS